MGTRGFIIEIMIQECLIGEKAVVGWMGEGIIIVYSNIMIIVVNWRIFRNYFHCIFFKTILEFNSPSKISCHGEGADFSQESIYAQHLYDTKPLWRHEVVIPVLFR